MTTSSLIGKKVYPKDGTYYASHVAYIKEYKGDGMYILAGGSLGSVEPIMHRSEFVIHREKKVVTHEILDMYQEKLLNEKLTLKTIA